MSFSFLRSSTPRCCSEKASSWSSLRSRRSHTRSYNPASQPAGPVPSAQSPSPPSSSSSSSSSSSPSLSLSASSSELFSSPASSPSGGLRARLTFRRKILRSSSRCLCRSPTAPSNSAMSARSRSSKLSIARLLSSSFSWHSQILSASSDLSAPALSSLAASDRSRWSNSRKSRSSRCRTHRRSSARWTSESSRDFSAQSSSSAPSKEAMDSSRRSSSSHRSCSILSRAKACSAITSSLRADSRAKGPASGGLPFFMGVVWAGGCSFARTA
mmetsp:Transcript_48767/g.161573  ORF Transcript_48767/g.161573 Transcript_48767/m.161573 type:complete len:271 (+) Transcript_48767:907-1719(+)